MLMDVSTYIVNNASTLFGPSSCSLSKINITQKRFTSIVYFCEVQFQNGDNRKIVIKHYDDYYPNRTLSLFKEFDFSTSNFQAFESDDIGIPQYIHFDAEEKLVVINYIDDSCRFEETLLTTHKYYSSRPLSKIFRNSGLWLSLYHSVHAELTVYEINRYKLLAEIKDKWLQEFDNENQVHSDLECLVTDTVSEGKSYPISLLHKEYAPGNILHVGNKVYGIDFGSMEQGCVLDDVAYFVVSTLVLNKYPGHPFYKRIQYKSEEIRSFFNGYLHHSNIQESAFDSSLFRFFLYKNLIRRLSSQLRVLNRNPKYLDFSFRLAVYNLFHRIRSQIYKDT